MTKVRQGASGLNPMSWHRRIVALEAEVQEARRLNRRVAELLDVVEELLVPIALRDEDKVREYVERHSSSL